jgi:hypothetical protein
MINMSKRKADQSDSIEIDNFEETIKNLSKKSKMDNEWISGTTIANYLNGEPLLDWLKLYYNEYGFNEGRITRSTVKKYKQTNSVKLETNTTEQNPLLSNGLLFESKVYEDLEGKFKKAFFKIDTFKNGCEIDFDKGFEETLKQLEMKTPIIAQAVLLDRQTK